LPIRNRGCCARRARSAALDVAAAAGYGR
jgi:hypothetical protein